MHDTLNKYLPKISLELCNQWSGQHLYSQQLGNPDEKTCQKQHWRHLLSSIDLSKANICPTISSRYHNFCSKHCHDCFGKGHHYNNSQISSLLHHHSDCNWDMLYLINAAQVVILHPMPSLGKNYQISSKKSFWDYNSGLFKTLWCQLELKWF